MVSSVSAKRKAFISCTTLELCFSRREMPEMTSATKGSMQSTKSESLKLM